MKDPPSVSKPCPRSSADQPTNCNAGAPDVAANTDDLIVRVPTTRLAIHRRLIAEGTRLDPWHRDLIDLMIVTPRLSGREAAARFGVSPRDIGNVQAKLLI